jgi:hypothetical protein
MEILDFFEVKDWFENSTFEKVPNEFGLMMLPNIVYRLNQLIEYYTYLPTCEIALQDVQKIADSYDNLDCPATKEWLVQYEELGTKTLILFMVDYYDYQEPFEHLRIRDEDFAINKTPFLPIVKFCEVFNVLYWQYEYHLDKDKRATYELDDYYNISLGASLRS